MGCLYSATIQNYGIIFTTEAGKNVKQIEPDSGPDFLIGIKLRKR